MKIIKRNGSEAEFDIAKIVAAVTKANAACEKEELTASQISDIAEYVEFKIQKAARALSVEEIQDIVENQIMAQGAFEVAKRYVKYRYKGKHLFLSNKEKTIIFLKNHFFNIEKTLFYKLIMYLCKVI